MGEILKLQDGHHGDPEKNGNIGFWIQYVLKFSKMYSFANLQEIRTKAQIVT